MLSNNGQDTLFSSQVPPPHMYVSVSRKIIGDVRVTTTLLGACWRALGTLEYTDQDEGAQKSSSRITLDAVHILLNTQFNMFSSFMKPLNHGDRLVLWGN